MTDPDHTPDPKILNRWLKAQKTSANGRLSKAIALGAINGLLMIGQTMLLAFIINSIVFTQQDLTLSIVGIVAIIVLRAALGYASECYSRRGAMAIQSQLRSQLLIRLFHSSLVDSAEISFLH